MRADIFQIFSQFNFELQPFHEQLEESLNLSGVCLEGCCEKKEFNKGESQKTDNQSIINDQEASHLWKNCLLPDLRCCHYPGDPFCIFHLWCMKTWVSL